MAENDVNGRSPSTRGGSFVHIETVLGPVGPEEIGATLMHEHLGSVALAGFYTGGDESAADDLILRAVQPLGELGVGTVVDLTGRGRAGGEHDLSLLGRLAPRVPVHIVAGFSYYKDPWLQGSGEEDIDTLTGTYVDAANGVIDGMKAGLFGEVGTSLDEITPGEELHLRSAARAHLITGLAISTHCTVGTMALEQLAILADEGVDMGKVVLGHLDLRPDVEFLEEVLAFGANIAFDTWGKEWFDYRVPNSEGETPGEFIKWAFHRPDDDRVEALAELCRRGHDGRIVLSCDISGAEAWLNPATHGRFGFSYLSRIVLPRLQDVGVSSSSCHEMLVSNPARILAVP